MRNYNRRMILCLGVFLFISISYGQNDLKPWEKLGVSQTEWKIINDNNISTKKVTELLSAGINVSEYVQKPWEKIDLTESEWIEKRRIGLTSYDIELEAQTDRKGWKRDNKNALRLEADNVSSNAALLKSFVFPGYEQLKLDQKKRGKIMVGLAFASFVGTMVFTVKDASFNPTPIFIVLVPDMFWSMIDFKFSKKKTDSN